MAATNSVRIVKTIPYRGQTKRWSNRYHFVGGTPADTAHWNTLFDNITNAEKLLYGSGLQIVEALGYVAGSEVPVASKTYAITGAATFSGYPCPGDSAAMLRFATAARSSKNHPVYLWNWFHGAQWSGTGSSDTLLAAQKSAIETYAGLWDTTGFSDGSITVKRAGPNGASATGHECDPFVRHRDFRN